MRGLRARLPCRGVVLLRLRRAARRALRGCDNELEPDARFCDGCGTASIERTHGIAVGLRVGVNTGEVVVSPDCDDVVGDPVNVAARLEGAAAPGQVMVGPETARHVRDHVKLEPMEPFSLKGKRDPVPAARVVGARQVVFPPRFRFWTWATRLLPAAGG